jgi:hypothetical protein
VLTISQISNGNNDLTHFLVDLYMPGLADKGSRNKNMLRTTTSVPYALEHWERLYYLMLAEVRRLHADLRERFGQDLSKGSVILHDLGFDGESLNPVPMSAVSITAMLEDMWFTLTDPRIVAPLDKAVRVRQANEDLHPSETSELPMEDVFELLAEMTDVADGLVDTNNMTPCEIINMTWVMQAAEVQRRLRDDIPEHTLLSIANCEVREAGIGVTDGTKPPIDMTAHCMCSSACHCREQCEEHIDECPCAQNRNQVRAYVAKHYELENGSPTSTVTSSSTCSCGDHGFDLIDLLDVDTGPTTVSPPTPEERVPEMLCLGRNDFIIRAFFGNSENANRLDKEFLASMQQRARERSNTKNSDLAYVPAPAPRTPARRNGPKDPYPMGFYGDESLQRYPSMRRAMSDEAPPSFQIPRKPVLAPLVALGTPTSDPFSAVTPPESSPLGSHPVCYPNIPKSHSDGLFPPFTPPSSKKKHYVAQTDRTVSPADYSSLASEAHDSIRPFDEQVEKTQLERNNSVKSQVENTPFERKTSVRSQVQRERFGRAEMLIKARLDKAEVEKERTEMLSETYVDKTDAEKTDTVPDLPFTRPQLFPTATAPADLTTMIVPKIRTASPLHSMTVPKTRTPSPLRGDANKNKPFPPLPPLPDPEFIRPRPAMKQRYVSAGGNLPLHERQEIPGPAFYQQCFNHNSGHGIHRDELFERLKEPEYIVANFGPEALAKMQADYHQRVSDEYNDAVNRTSPKSWATSGRTSGGVSSKRGSGRKSDESGLKGQRMSREDELMLEAENDKRGRTQSGSSTGSNGRFGKLKRVFSRKSSDVD